MSSRSPEAWCISTVSLPVVNRKRVGYALADVVRPFGRIRVGP